MIIALTGAHGFIGQEVLRQLQQAGLTVRPIARRGNGFDWTGLTGADVIIHLAGRNIASRWTASFKSTMLAERAAGVQSLQQALKDRPNPPRVVIIASAIGWYGNAAGPVDESAPSGIGFAAEICRVLEAGRYPTGTRVVHARIGVVMHPSGGALARMLPAFRLGLGGPIGSGAQPLSWISRHDVAAALIHCAIHAKLKGPVNLVAPTPLPQREFAAILGQALRRPALLPMPTYMVKLLFGQMGEELLLQGAHVRADKLLHSGFEFRHPTLHTALNEMFGRT